MNISKMKRILNRIVVLVAFLVLALPCKARAADVVYYRVGTAWDSTINQAVNQVGAYSVLSNAKDQCDACGSGYYVFDWNGNVVYPTGNNDVAIWRK